MANHDYSINGRIKFCRKQNKLTQAEMGRLMGIKATTYAEMEKKGYITAENLIIISKILGVDVRYFLYGTHYNPFETTKK